MTFVPSFKCTHCGSVKASRVSGDQGLFVPCGCDDAQKAWEQEHRASVERRKQARVRMGGKKK